MSFRSCGVVFGLFVLLFVIISTGSRAGAQSSQQPSMSSAAAPGGEEADPRKLFVAQVHLGMYEAAAGDLSLCADEEDCLVHATRIKSWVCVAGVCKGADQDRKPVDCFKGILDKYPKETQNQINSSFCSLIESPGALTRQAFLTHLPSSAEDGLVENGAYLLALNGSAGACENYIKNYVGAYGSQWNYQWYRAMSGCRILAHETTREQEEKDFYTWFGVVQGVGNCSAIVNSEMRQACSAPGATSPLAPHGQ